MEALEHILAIVGVAGVLWVAPVVFPDNCSVSREGIMECPLCRLVWADLGGQEVSPPG